MKQMTSVLFSILAMLALNENVTKADDAKCSATPYVFDDDGKVTGLKGESKDLRFDKKQSKKAEYSVAQTALSLVDGYVARVSAQYASNGDQNLLRINTRVEKVTEGRVDLFASPSETHSWVEPLEGMPFALANTLQTFENYKMVEEFLNFKENQNLLPDQYLEALLLAATGTQKFGRGKLFRVDVKCFYKKT